MVGVSASTRSPLFVCDRCGATRRPVAMTESYGDQFVCAECPRCGSLRIDGGFVAEAAITDRD